MPDFKAEISVRLAELQLSPSREAEIVEELSQRDTPRLATVAASVTKFQVRLN